jgi:UDP-N-acetylmuramyl pentapeptide synthase
MQAVPLPNGAILIRDDFNRATATLDVALDLLRDAACARRVLIINDMKDPTRDLPERMRYIGRRTAERADLALFAGPGADHARAAAIEAGMEPTRIFTADSFREAAAFIREQTQAGDVVLLRNGIGPHLARLYYASLGEIGCWLDRCPYEQLCDSCSQLQFVPESALKQTGGELGASSVG